MAVVLECFGHAFSRRPLPGLGRAGWALIALVAALASAPGVARAREPKWALEERVGHVALYTAEVEAHGYDVVKAVVTLPVPAAPIVAMLRDFADYPRWYHACKQVRVLERPSSVSPLQLDGRGRFIPHAASESYLLLYLQDASPLDDRWALVVNTLRIEHGALVIDFHSVTRPGVHGPAHAVPMRLHGRWELSPLAPNRTRVTFVLDVDPNTSTPAFLVDPQIHDIALRTLQNLDRALTRPRHDPTAAVR